MLNKKNKMKKKKKQQQPMGTRKFKMKIGIINMMLREISTQFEALPQARREKFSFFPDACQPTNSELWKRSKKKERNISGYGRVR